MPKAQGASPCANCKTRSTSPPKAAICIRSGKRWSWSRNARKWRSYRCIPSGIFSALGMCWCRRFCWGFAVKIMCIWRFFTEPPSDGCALKQNLTKLDSIIFTVLLLYLSTQFIPNKIPPCISPLFALDYAPFLAFMIYNYACFRLLF